MTTRPPRVSVVMSVYNDERYLGESMESILSQTFTDFEFIIVNDGSTDNTRATVRSYADPRIRLVENEVNLGLPTSLNKGIRLAKGEYIARQDADDVSLPERLERQTGFLDAHRDVALVGSGWVRIDLDGDEFSTGAIANGDDAIKAGLIQHNVKFPHGSLMFRKDALDRVGGYDTRFLYTQDLDLLLRMAKTGYAFGAIEHPLYKFRLRLAPDDFKKECQAEYRALAYERYHSVQEVDIPDVPGHVRALASKDVVSRRRRLARYWYAVGMGASASGRYGQALKCLRKSWLAGDIGTPLRFTAKLALEVGKSIFTTNHS